MKIFGIAFPGDALFTALIVALPAILILVSIVHKVWLRAVALRRLTTLPNNKSLIQLALALSTVFIFGMLLGLEPLLMTNIGAVSESLTEFMEEDIPNEDIEQFRFNFERVMGDTIQRAFASSPGLTLFEQQRFTERFRVFAAAVSDETIDASELAKLNTVFAPATDIPVTGTTSIGD